MTARAEEAGGAERPASASAGTRAGAWGRFRLDGSERAMLAIVVCMSIVILALPVIVLWLSFREAPPIEPVSAYSFLHYVEAFADPSILRALANTLVFTLVSLAVALCFGIPAAWIRPSRGRLILPSASIRNGRLSISSASGARI